MKPGVVIFSSLGGERGNCGLVALPGGPSNPSITGGSTSVSRSLDTSLTAIFISTLPPVCFGRSPVTV